MRAALILLVALAGLIWVESSAGAAPRFVRNIDTDETGWFASPGLVDLNGDRRLEIVAPFYSTFVPRQAAARHPPAQPGDERQRHRDPRGALDRRPRPRRPARDRRLDVRPRDRRLPRPAIEREAPAVADRPRQPAAQRRALRRDSAHPLV
jgi:hypothetical protein